MSLIAQKKRIIVFWPSVMARIKMATTTSLRTVGGPPGAKMVISRWHGIATITVLLPPMRGIQKFKSSKERNRTVAA